MKNTFTVNGYKLRLDTIKTISPLRTYKQNLDGIFVIFMRDSKQSFDTQYEFTITFTGKNGGYQDFLSEIVSYQGWDNFKGDEEFEKTYNDLVKAWEDYHDNSSVFTSVEMIEFANYAKCYQSDKRVDKAFEAYLNGERIKNKYTEK